MKKFVSILLLAAFCLSMAACSSVDKEFEAADALLQAGDYEGAIAAFSSIGRYQEIKAKLNEAEKLLREANYGFLFGLWTDLLYRDQGVNSIMIREDGKAILRGYTTTFTYIDGVLCLDSPLDGQLVFEEIDGVKHLRGSLDGVEMDFVTADDFEELGPYTVTLNMDNWSEYFELREAVQVQLNQFGEVQYASNGYGIFLKDEYVDKMHYNSLYPNGIDFQMSYDEACFMAPVSSVEEAIKTIYYKSELKQVDLPIRMDSFTESGKIATASISDWKNLDNCGEMSSYYCKIAGDFYEASPEYLQSSGEAYVSLPVNPQIINVQGQLILLR